MSNIIKYGLLYLFAIGCGVWLGFYWFGSTPNYNDRNRLIEEIRVLKMNREELMKSIVFFDSAFQVEFVKQDLEHENEMIKLKQSHNGKRIKIRELATDTIGTLSEFARQAN